VSAASWIIVASLVVSVVAALVAFAAYVNSKPPRPKFGYGPEPPKPKPEPKADHKNGDPADEPGESRIEPIPEELLDQPVIPKPPAVTAEAAKEPAVEPAVEPATEPAAEPAAEPDTALEDPAPDAAPSDAAPWALTWLSGGLYRLTNQSGADANQVELDAREDGPKLVERELGALAAGASTDFGASSYVGMGDHQLTVTWYGPDGELNAWRTDLPS
jgi:hypothetical protein